MRNKVYCRILLSSIVVLAITTLSLSTLPATHCYAQGGYGGAAEPETEDPELPPGFTSVTGEIDSTGVFITDVTVESADAVIQLTIDEGTTALDSSGDPLSGIIINEIIDPPDPPADKTFVGLAYELGPEGATFDPPITLTFTYDTSDLPQDVAEGDLVLAIWDEDDGEWVELEDFTIDQETNTISVSISHFSKYAIITKLPPPPSPPSPAFSLSELAIQPLEAQPGETVKITVEVTNTGDLEGSYSVILKINGLKEQEKLASLVASEESRTATFSVAKEEIGNYSVTVGYLSGSFSVVAPAAPEEVVVVVEEEEVVVEEEVVPEVVPEKAPIAWWVWVIVGVVGVAIAVIIWLAVRRRRA